MAIDKAAVLEAGFSEDAALIVLLTLPLMKLINCSASLSV